MCKINLHTRNEDEIETNIFIKYDKIILKVMPYYILEICISVTTVKAQRRPLSVNKVIKPNFL